MTEHEIEIREAERRETLAYFGGAEFNRRYRQRRAEHQDRWLRRYDGAQIVVIGEDPEIEDRRLRVGYGLFDTLLPAREGEA